MRKYYWLVIMLLAAQAQAFDVSRARDLVNTLAADGYEGRRSGTDAGRRTEYLLATKLSDYGVNPGGQAGYFQPVPMLVTTENGSSLTLMESEFGRIPFTLGVDYTVVTHSGTGSTIAPVVIAGYGYATPDKGRNDYGEMDVKDKIVLIIRGYPKSPYDFTEEYSRRWIVSWARERRAAAVLFYQDVFPTMGAAIPEIVYDPDLPLMYVGDRVLSLLLDGTGYSMDTYKDALKNGPLPLETGKQMYLATRVARERDGAGRNVLGIVYGSDPVLKNEIIVIGAHMDHVGRNSDGVIYNGADDNASGSAIASELARTFAERPCKRSVMILHFTGEEDGLIGSNYFVRNPSIPLRNIVGYINLDMDGTGTGDVSMVGGELFGPVWSEYYSSLDSTTRSHIRLHREHAPAASDHESFMMAGCPTLAFWSRGPHPFYHAQDDDAEWISNAGLQAVGERAESFVRFLGDRSGSLAAQADSSLVVARLATTIDFVGFPVDGLAAVPALACPTAAWVSRDAALSGEVLRRMSEIRYYCSTHQIEANSLKDALTAERDQKSSLFFGLTEADVNTRRPAEIDAFARQGLSVVRLSAGSTNAERAAESAVLERARTQGLFALIPFDFAAPRRVEKWKSHSLVSATFKTFAEAPSTVRDGLLSSDALLILEVTEAPTAEQLQAVLPARQRRVHLSFGSIPRERRDEHARLVVKALFDAGVSRHDAMLMTGGNLRRFFEL